MEDAGSASLHAEANAIAQTRRRVALIVQIGLTLMLVWLVDPLTIYRRTARAGGDSPSVAQVDVGGPATAVPRSGAATTAAATSNVAADAASTTSSGTLRSMAATDPPRAAPHTSSTQRPAAPPPVATDALPEGPSPSAAPVAAVSFDDLRIARGLEQLPGGPLPAFDPEAPLGAVAPPLTATPVRRAGGDDQHLYARLLTSDVIAGKYGLTNVLMFGAAMLAYGAMDDRAVLFPKRSPVDVEELLNLTATEELLRPANVVIISRRDFAGSPVVNVSWARARKLALSFGFRTTIGSGDITVAAGALAHERNIMVRSKKHRLLSHRDFFLSFPFRATAPMDMCFFIKRLVFADSIRRQAALVLRALRAKGVQRYVAVHLRLESDAAMLRREAAGVTSHEVRRFFRDVVGTLVKQVDAQGVYVCAGKLKPEFVEATKAAPVPVFFKSDFPEANISMTNVGVVTSHFGAAADMLLMGHATAAVGMLVSTFSLGVLTHRCPSPRRGTPVDAVALKRFSWMGTGVSHLVDPTPGAARVASPPVPPRRPFEGLLAYEFNATGHFTELTMQTCEHLFSWCYYDTPA